MTQQLLWFKIIGSNDEWNDDGADSEENNQTLWWIESQLAFATCE